MQLLLHNSNDLISVLISGIVWAVWCLQVLCFFGVLWFPPTHIPQTYGLIGELLIVGYSNCAVEWAEEEKVIDGKVEEIM